MHVSLIKVAFTICIQASDFRRKRASVSLKPELEEAMICHIEWKGFLAPMQLQQALQNSEPSLKPSYGTLI